LEYSYLGCCKSYYSSAIEILWRSDIVAAILYKIPFGIIIYIIENNYYLNI
jgi:hypothetical protein